MSYTRMIEDAPNQKNDDAVALERLPKLVFDNILSYIVDDVRTISVVSHSLNIRVAQWIEETFGPEYEKALPLLVEYFRKNHIHLVIPQIDNLESFTYTNHRKVINLLPATIAQHTRLANKPNEYFYQYNEQESDLVLLFPANLQAARSWLKKTIGSYPCPQTPRIIVMFALADSMNDYLVLKSEVPKATLLYVTDISKIDQDIIIGPTIPDSEQANRLALIARKTVLAIKAAIDQTVLSNVIDNSWERRVLLARKEARLANDNERYRCAMDTLNAYANARAKAIRNNMKLLDLDRIAKSWPKYGYPDNHYVNFIEREDTLPGSKGARSDYIKAKSQLIERFIEFGTVCKASSGFMTQLSADIWDPTLRLVNTLIADESSEQECGKNRYKKYRTHANQMNAVADLLIIAKTIVSDGETPETIEQLKKQITKVEKTFDWMSKHRRRLFVKLLSSILIALAAIAIVVVAVLAPPLFSIIPCAIFLLAIAARLSVLNVNYYPNKFASNEVTAASKAWSGLFTTRPVSDIDISQQKPSLSIS